METNAPGTKDRILTFLVPANKHHVVLNGFHHEAGHQGRDRMLSLLRERFWWPGMGVQATLSVKNCERCCRYEARPSLPEMVMIGATEPLDLVHMDFIGMETTLATRKLPVVKTVLVLVDQFTWYIHAYIIEDCQATTVAKVLYDEYFSVFGFPHWLMSDNAPEFIGKVLMAICHTYNLTRSQVTGYSLHFLMFGRRPHLPIDLIFPTARQEAVKGVDHYVSTLYEHLRHATSLARAVADKEAQRFKRIYDK